MVPARNLLRRHYDSYGGGCSFVDVDTHYSTTPTPAKPPPSPSSLRSNLMMMAEHHQASRPGPQQEQQQQQTQQTEESDQQEAGTSPSNAAAAAGDSWLQLGIAIPSSSSSQAAAASAAGPSVELQLFSDKPSSSSPSPPTVRRPTLPPPMFSAQVGYRPPPPWGAFWPSNLMSVNASGSSSTGAYNPMMMMMPPSPQFYNAQRFPLPPAVESGPHYGGELIRVVNPPARQQASGVWFHLRSADNQVKEPFLPQIPKSYIRIKDGRMTVRLLMKYLAKKLGLDDESEVQISCRGQPLPPYLTIQHVRDHIWCRSSEAIACVSDSPTIDHVMTLHYGRSP